MGVCGGRSWQSLTAGAVCSIVVQGGPGTIGTAHDAILNGTPLVVVEGTGGAADVLAYAWRFLHDTGYGACLADDGSAFVAYGHWRCSARRCF